MNHVDYTNVSSLAEEENNLTSYIAISVVKSYSFYHCFKCIITVLCEIKYT